jgi:hypothetical protein
MRWIVTAMLLAVGGCAGGIPYSPPVGFPTPSACVPNPVFLPVKDHQQVWETLVDVIDDYFKIEREEPLRQIGAVLTEGRLDTFPEVGSTLFEPWRGDSASPEEQLESTLQSIRRYAQVKVAPDRGGYWVNVEVFKELEDVIQPAHSTAGAATFRNDSSLARVTNPVGDQDINQGWIPEGRDAALEQRILTQLQSRLAPSPRPGMPGWSY